MGGRLNNLSPYKITSKGIALVPERNKVFETLTTEENLSISVSRLGAQKETERKIYEYFPQLYERRKHLAGFLSGGERQMLAMGQALLCSPKLLLVDELSLGLAPLIIAHLIQTLMQMKQDLGLTILIVEQNAAVALGIADYAAVMENGRIVFDGTPQRLLGHQDVREFYLGLHESGEKSYRDIKQYRRSRRWWG